MAKETENLKLSLYDPIEDKDVKVKDVINNVLGYTNSNTTKIDAKFKGVDDNVQILHDYILDPDGNVLFYSKSKVDELLAGKLSLTGGAMAGELMFGDIAGKIYIGPNDAAYGPEEGLNNLVIESWNGISFSAASSQQVYYKKTAVGIDCRNSIVKARRFEGVADNGVVAYGPNYVRFGDGTQICCGAVRVPSGIAARNTATFSFTFPMAFADANYIKTISQRNDPGGSWNVAVVNTGMRTTGFDALIVNGDTTFALNEGAVFEYIAIGRWK